MAKKDTKVVKKSGKAKEEQTEREIIGVCFIAIALFLGAGIYTDLVGYCGTATRRYKKAATTHTATEISSNFQYATA